MKIEMTLYDGEGLNQSACKYVVQTLSRGPNHNKWVITRKELGIRSASYRRDLVI